MTESLQQEKENTCRQCGRPLHGRSDKTFCNDGCRNTFNRRKREHQRSLDHSNMPEIFRTIKSNYDILKSLTSGEPLEKDLRISLETKALSAKGFNPKFFTSSYQDSEGTWHFCFERGWLIQQDYCQVMDRPEQARIG